ncbi:ABC transporter ATP-binding protein [Candidatus Xianfuyuplasma coldseepsis]|uniref:ABC transporter ATP-binding protein n=1 Tax=Candidatus Xianfuyuplasma coldseepsis TaxID=2782163 RepID=A0A7L7KPG9_9MOLU|nr:ABC transporter ATP-binding protein [Xianfuyuplasma coldseepsis]QMS84557.1 ABC transporter ATP-binding protein [Xianfuyuplasma coldseepsis]
MKHAIKVQNLSKSYDDVKAVKNISFTVERDTFFAFLGPNGAGKSTTINIISTLLEPNQGNIEVLGYTLGKDDMKIRELIGVVFQTAMLDDLLTVRENLSIRASFYNIHKEEFITRLNEIDAYLNIMGFVDQRYGELSGGQRRKADIARALFNWPEILILDEPTTGLDPKSRKDIWRLISKLRDEKEITIFLTTHYMEEVVDANKIVVIDEGEIVAEGSSEELRLQYSSDRVKIIPKNGLEERLQKDSVPFYKVNDLINIELDSCFEGLDIIETYKDYISEFEILRGDMDDVFVNITGRKLGDE